MVGGGVSDTADDVKSCILKHAPCMYVLKTYNVLNMTVFIYYYKSLIKHTR